MAELDQVKFHEDLAREDDLGVVIRAHIHVENQLDKVIDQLAPNPKAIEKMDLDYSKRVELALVLGLPAVFRSPLLALGRLRNEFAHQLNAEISKERAKKFFDTFDSNLKNIMNAAQNQAKKEVGEGVTQGLGGLPPRELFIRCTIFLHSAMRASWDKPAEQGESGA